MICPDCGGIFKNIGAHKRFCKAVRPKLVVDDYMEKPLSSIISGIREVLKSHQYQITVTTTENNGVAEDVELKVRFQLRR